MSALWLLIGVVIVLVWHMITLRDRWDKVVSSLGLDFDASPAQVYNEAHRLWFDKQCTSYFRRYRIEVYLDHDCDDYPKRYHVDAPNEDVARLLAVAMDGGFAMLIDDWHGCIELAKMHTTVVSKQSARKVGA